MKMRTLMALAALGFAAAAAAADLSDEQKKALDAALQQRGLNEYGDPPGTMYMGGTPLFDESTGPSIDRYDYVLKKHPDLRRTVMPAGAPGQQSPGAPGTPVTTGAGGSGAALPISTGTGTAPTPPTTGNAPLGLTTGPGLTAPTSPVTGAEATAPGGVAPGGGAPGGTAPAGPVPVSEAPGAPAAPASTTTDPASVPQPGTHR